MKPIKMKLVKIKNQNNKEQVKIKFCIKKEKVAQLQRTVKRKKVNEWKGNPTFDKSIMKILICSNFMYLLLEFYISSYDIIKL